MVTVFSSTFQSTGLIIVFLQIVEQVRYCNAFSLFDVGNIRLGNDYDLAREYSFPTNWPINIDTKLTKLVITSPIQYTTGPLAKQIVQNNGKTVLVKNNETRPLDSITGGLFGNNTYIFDHGRFYWVNDTNERAGTTINNQSYPLELTIYYWNKKYGSFKNALKHRDGLAVLDFIYKVDTLPNPLYPTFGNHLKQIKQAGTEVPAIVGSILLMLLPYTPEYYYLYPGSNTDEHTGKTYYCANYILQILPIFISRSQFQDFLNLRNFAERPFTNQALLFPYRGQPIMSGIGATVTPQFGD